MHTSSDQIHGDSVRPETGLSDSRSGLLGDRARRHAAVYISLVIFVLSAFADVLNGYGGVAILTATLLLGLPGAGRSSLASTLAFTGVGIFVMPYIGLIYMGFLVQTAWLALFIVTAVVLVAFGETTAPAASTPGHGAADLPLIIIFLVGGLLLWGSEGLQQVSFYAGWAFALVHLERIHAQTRSIVYRGLGLLAFAAVIGYFTTVLWSGGGRIVQLSFALAPILLTVQYGSFRLNALMIAAAAAALSFAGRLLRFGWSDGIAGLSEDSGASPITITSYLWHTSDSVLARGSIVDQWVLLFLNWYPRNLWPSKPTGIGSSFVNLVVGRQGVSAEHNLAIGFFGEHLFLLPQSWFISVGLLVGVLILLRRALARFLAPYRTPVIIFDVWLITLFWGGMASFAARAWLALIPLIPYLIIVRVVVDRRRNAAGMNFDKQSGLV